MKKILFVEIVLFFFIFVPHVFAEGFVALSPIPGLTDASALSVAKSTHLASFFNNLYKYLIGIAAILAVIEIIWGGLQYATQDSPGGKSGGKDRIVHALLGLVLVLSPALVFSIINPSILNLSVNLKELDTKSTTSAQATSCPAGTIGTPPTCARPCGNGIRTDCNKPTSFDEGYYESPPSGSNAYCVQPIKPTPSDAAYLCTGTLEKCKGSYGLIKSLGTNNVVGGADGCVLYP